MPPDISTAALGSGGLVVGAQGLGCMGMSEFYGATDEPSAVETLAAAVDAGVTLFDTADMYGEGANERFLSPFVRAHRDQVVIATKFGNIRERDGSMSTNNHPDYIRQAVEAIAGQVTGDRYPDMTETSTAREA